MYCSLSYHHFNLVLSLLSLSLNLLSYFFSFFFRFLLAPFPSLPSPPPLVTQNLILSQFVQNMAMTVTDNNYYFPNVQITGQIIKTNLPTNATYVLLFLDYFSKLFFVCFFCLFFLVFLFFVFCFLFFVFCFLFFVFCFLFFVFCFLFFCFFVFYFL